MDPVKDLDSIGSLAVSFFSLQFGQATMIFDERCNCRFVSDWAARMPSNVCRLPWTS
jgi:hypothetical protein